MRLKAYVWNAVSETYQEVTGLSDLSRFEVIEVESKTGVLILRLAVKPVVQ
jgi:hypothetical protein